METLLQSVLLTNSSVIPQTTVLGIFIYLMWSRLSKMENAEIMKEAKHIKCREEMAGKFQALEKDILNGIHRIELQLAEKKGAEDLAKNIATAIMKANKKSTDEE